MFVIVLDMFSFYAVINIIVVPAADLYRAVVFAHFYKIPFVHVHLTDDHAWTWPSENFPLLGTKNIGFRGPVPLVYSADGLRQVVEFADARGVALVPELEGPGHSSAMRRSDPSFQGRSN